MSGRYKTGLKDCNGVEIRQGDLLRIGAGYEPVEVKYGQYTEVKRDKHVRRWTHIGFYVGFENAGTPLIEKMSFLQDDMSVKFRPDYCEVVGYVETSEESV